MKVKGEFLLRGFSACLVLFVLLAVAARSIRAQDTEVQKMKQQIDQLLKTVEELKQKVQTIEEGPKAPEMVPGETENKPGGPPEAPENQDEKSTMELYGFAMLDMGFQFRQNHPDWFDVIRPTQLPSFRDQYAPNGKFYTGVRQSRLGVKTSTPTRFGELKTIFEFELFGTGADAGKTTFRLRHAYGELGKVGAGQYWTVFGDTDAYPNTFEYWGPNGLVWFRNVQLRFMPLKGKNSVTIALERPGASGDAGVAADRIDLAGIRPKLAWPDLTGHVRFDRDWGHIQVSGVLRSIRWVDTDHSDEFDFGGSALGYGGSFSSHLNFGEKNIGRFQVTYGKGIENYMNDAPVDIGARFTHAAAGQRPFEGVAVPVLGLSTFLDHTWNDRFTSSIGYSLIDMDNTDAQAPDAYRRGQYGLVNLIYSPVKNVVMGGELQWGRRANFSDGFSSEDVRIQFSFKYNFARVVKF
jgi:hypothetical protein